MHNTVCSFFLAVIHYDANSPNFTFYGSRNKRQRNFLSLSKSGYGSQEFNSKRQGRRQPIIKTSWPGPTNFWFDHCTAFNKSCVVEVKVLVRSVRTSHACSFQDMWKSKSAKRATSRKAGYAPGVV